MGEYSENELLRLTHGPLDQAPYLEFYLDETGTEKIAYEKAVSMEVRRISFFLHSVDVSQPLNIKQGKKVVQTLSLPQITKLPERLMPFCFYIPYD